MSQSTESIQKKKVITWIVVGASLVALTISTLVFLSQMSNESLLESQKITLNEAEVEQAESAALSFTRQATNFGVALETSESGTLSHVAALLKESKGFYGRSAFGISRAENYRWNLIPFLDPRGELNTTDHFGNTLNGYFPDWSGQLLNYSGTDYTARLLEPWVEGTTVLVVAELGFTGEINAFQENRGAWNHLQRVANQSVSLVLSLQPDGTWLIWSAKETTDAPYITAFWQNPDWRAHKPQLEFFEKIS